MIYDINISYRNAIEDLENLQNILLSSYSGKDYWQQKGVTLVKYVMLYEL